MGYSTHDLALPVTGGGRSAATRRLLVYARTVKFAGERLSMAVSDDTASNEGVAPLRTEHIRELMERSGLRSVHVLAWRDLADPEAGGSEVHAARIAGAWAAEGLNVTMRTSAAAGHPSEEQRDGYRVIRRSGRHVVFPSTVVEQVSGRLGRPDALLEVWNGVPYLSPIWSRRPKVVFIHHVHREMWSAALRPGLARFGHVLEHRIAPPFYRRTRVLTPSQATREEVIEYLGLPAANVRVVGPGVDDHFTPGGTKADSPTVLCVGRLVPHKRVDELIRMMPRLRLRVPGARLLVLGSGYCRGELENLVDSLDAGSFVELRGRVSDEELVDAYRAAWVVTSASFAEGWGMTITEAAACGTPAVVTRVGGHCDSVSEGDSGLLADSLNELENQLVEVLTDDELRTSLALGARKRGIDSTWTATATTVFGELAAAADPTLGVE